MWFYWFRITTIQHWQQICHGHFKLGASWNVTHYDFSYLGPLCGWAMSFLLCRVDHGNLRRVGGRRAQGDFNKLLPSHAGPSCKALESVSQAVLWLRALLSLVLWARLPVGNLVSNCMVLISVPPKDHMIWLCIDYISHAFIFLMSCSDAHTTVLCQILMNFSSHLYCCQLVMKCKCNFLSAISILFLFLCA